MRRFIFSGGLAAGWGAAGGLAHALIFRPLRGGLHEVSLPMGQGMRTIFRFAAGKAVHSDS